MSGLYRRSPHEVVDGVPVFRNTDDYIENYDQISADHLASVDRGHGNPFMNESIWNDLEKNTIDFIETHVTAGSSVLDIGVGTGRMLSRFPNLRRYGIDVSIGYLSRLGNSGIEVCKGNVEDLPYRDAIFDAVVCTDVLEHVIDLYAAVRDLQRVLRPGGVAIIRVPYRESLAQYNSPDCPYRLVHVRSFDEHSLEILFCRILDFQFHDQRFDKCLAPDQLCFPLPRGAGIVTRLLTRIVRRVPGLKSTFLLFFRPIEISMVFRKKV